MVTTAKKLVDEAVSANDSIDLLLRKSLSDKRQICAHFAVTKSGVIENVKVTGWPKKELEPDNVVQVKHFIGGLSPLPPPPNTLVSESERGLLLIFSEHSGVVHTTLYSPPRANLDQRLERSGHKLENI